MRTLTSCLMTQKSTRTTRSSSSSTNLKMRCLKRTESKRRTGADCRRFVECRAAIPNHTSSMMPKIYNLPVACIMIWLTRVLATILSASINHSRRSRDAIRCRVPSLARSKEARASTGQVALIATA